MNIRKSLLLFFLILSCAAFAIEYRLQEVKFPSDILANQVNNILRTTDGMMWIATTSGLSRYDGYEFENFQCLSHDSTTIASNYVWALTEDPRGRLWIRTDVGFSVYDFTTETFCNDIDQLLSTHGIEGNLTRIVSDQDEHLWIYLGGDRPGLYVLRKGADKAELVGGSNIVNQSELVCFDLTLEYMVATNKLGQIIMVDRAKGEVASVVEDLCPYIDKRGDTEVQVYADHDGLLWLWNMQDFWAYDLRKGELVPKEKFPKELTGTIRTFLQDNTGRVWVSIDRHGIQLLKKNHETGDYELSTRKISSLADYSITCLYEDHYGTVWIGSYKNGLFCYNDAANKFDLIEIPDVNVIEPEDINTAWIGTDKSGLWLCDFSTGLVKNIKDPADGDSPKAIVCLERDGKGGVFVGTCGGYVKHYTGSGWKHYGEAQGLISNNIWAIHLDNDDGLWIGTLGSGIQRLDLATGRMVNYNSYNSAIANDYISSFATAPNGNLYIATDNGIAIMNMLLREETYIPGSRFISEHMNQAEIDSRGLVWVASRNGLEVYDPANDQVTKINLGLMSVEPQVLGIAEDRDGNMWVSVGNILCCVVVTGVDPLEYHVHTFNYSDGLMPSDFNQRSLAVLEGGIFAAGNGSGVTYCLPGRLSHNSLAPEMMFTKLQINGETIRPGMKYRNRVVIDKSIMQCPTINLEANDNHFTIFFATDNFIVPEKTKFFYQLSGATDDWVQCPAGSHFISLNNLKAGTYTLSVKAINADGVASRQPISLQIVVHQPFWLSGWAWAIYAIALAALIFGMHRVVRRVLRRKKLLKRRKEGVATVGSIMSGLDDLIAVTEDPDTLRQLRRMRKDADGTMELVTELLRGQAKNDTIGKNK